MAEGPHFATGIKIGEVDASSAVVWVRLTREAQRVPMGAPLPVVAYRDPATHAPVDIKDNSRPDLIPSVTLPEGGVDALEGAAPGMAGKVRIAYTATGQDQRQYSAWTPVDPARDYTAQLQLTDLHAATSYEIEVEAASQDSDTATATLTGSFRTAPAPEEDAAVRFAVITCTDYPDRDLPNDGFKIYPAITALDPDFVVHAGDILYYDRLAKSQELARWHWQAMYSLPTNVAFHRGVSTYFIKDDHDTWVNDCWPTMQTHFMGEFTFEQGKQIFLEQVPMKEKTYRTHRWGKHLQIWMVEGRDYRSANTMKDGPGKTIWGAEQMRWFKESVTASDATYKVLISPTPVVGPDRDRKNDNHANAGFTHEGDAVREFIAAQGNMMVFCGDRHWQYASVHPKTGVREFSCGSGSNEHAGGWPKDLKKEEHRYVNVVGGFLTASVQPKKAQPSLVLKFHDVDGNELHQESFGIRDGKLQEITP